MRAGELALKRNVTFVNCNFILECLCILISLDYGAKNKELTFY